MNKHDTTPEAHCAACPMRKVYDRRCAKEDGKGPLDCPTQYRQEMAQQSLGVYKSEEFSKMAVTAALVERAGYVEANDTDLKATRPRIVELVDFSRRMEYTKLSLLFCLGLQKEAALAREILEVNGFTVISAICKVGWSFC